MYDEDRAAETAVTPQQESDMSIENGGPAFPADEQAWGGV